MIDRLRQMAIFAKAIDHGSFRGAAAELRLSPSVVSDHVSQLEAHLGVALIHRTTRKLRLTREGEALLAAAHKMLEAVEGELLKLSSAANQPSGELSITAPAVLSMSPLTNAFADFAKEHPRIQLNLDFSDSRRDLIDDGFDIAIRMGWKTKTTATSRLLFKVKRRLVASKAYLEEHAPVHHPKDVEDLDWILLAPVRNVPVSFQKAGRTKVTIKPKSRLVTTDAQALYGLARAGSGLAIVPEFLTTTDVAAGNVQFVLPDWEPSTLDVYAVWPSNAPKHGLIHLILDALSQREY